VKTPVFITQSLRKTGFGWLLTGISILSAGVIFTAGWLALPADGEVVVKEQGYVPFSEAPISYRSEDLSDPVAKLQKQMDRGEVKLEYEPGHGYLRSVLKLLRVSETSQTLVFSKTSFQYPKISPERPRALYYNDDVYIGQVHDGKSLEFVSFDPMQGAIFYVMDEHKVPHPRFERSELDCIQCHVAASTRGIPGVLVRSVYTTPSGVQTPKTPAFITGHESPLKERWGGWYVTSKVGAPAHIGNLLLPAGATPSPTAPGINVPDLTGRLDTTPYLTKYSDIVAHLVLAHQTQMHNLMTLTNYQTRLAIYAEQKKNPAADASGKTLSEAARKQYERPAEQLVRYLLFADEAPLDSPVEGTSGYAEQFAARGPRDSQGRSLRDFDLQKRIFRYPCSYLIYSEAFDSIPEPAKGFIYRRLFEVLTEREKGPDYAALSSDDRKAIFEILLATKPEFSDEWKQYQGSKNLSEAHLEPNKDKPVVSPVNP
jgi:hypothetical protein